MSYLPAVAAVSFDYSPTGDTASLAWYGADGKIVRAELLMTDTPEGRAAAMDRLRIERMRAGLQLSEEGDK